MAIPLIKDYELPVGVELARTPLPWKIDPTRTVLLIHDMQNHFVRRYESDAFVSKLVNNIERLRRSCHELQIPVFYTAQPGDQSKESRGLLIDFWGSGLREQGDAKNIVAGLEPVPGLDQMITKHRYSAFSRNDFGERLNKIDRPQLIICGVYAHIGCLVTATDAFMQDIEPFVVSDALGDFSLEHHQMALTHIAHCSGKILSTDDVLTQLKEQV